MSSHGWFMALIVLPTLNHVKSYSNILNHIVIPINPIKYWPIGPYETILNHYNPIVLPINWRDVQLSGALSPPGRGYDCGRSWQVLALGSVPWLGSALGARRSRPWDHGGFNEQIMGPSILVI